LAFIEKVSGGKTAKYVGDLAIAWWVLLVMCGISLVISVLYLWLLRCIAKPLLYFSFLLILLLFIGSGAFVWK